jgi:hypothetical protein
MGTASKRKIRYGFRSGKNIRQWCAARGIDFKTHMSQFPLMAGYYTYPPPGPVLKPARHASVTSEATLWQKIVRFICQLLQIR